jgi:hypothetical protein
MQQGPFVAFFALVAVVTSGCAADDIETVEADDADTVDEDTGEATFALQPHESTPGQPYIDEVCEEKCRNALQACVAACRSAPKDERPVCVGTCSAAYGECVRDCGWGRGCITPWRGWDML